MRNLWIKTQIKSAYSSLWPRHGRSPKGKPIKKNQFSMAKLFEILYLLSAVFFVASAKHYNLKSFWHQEGINQKQAQEIIELLETLLGWQKTTKSNWCECQTT